MYHWTGWLQQYGPSKHRLVCLQVSDKIDENLYSTDTSVLVRAIDSP